MPGAGLAQSALTQAVGLGFGLWLGPREAFLTLILLTTLSGIAIYVAGNLGVVMLARREGRLWARRFAHVVFPAVTSVAVLWVGYKSLVPLPPAPEKYAAIAAGIWLLLGVAVVLVATRRQRGAWASDARLGLHERLALEDAKL